MAPGGDDIRTQGSEPEDIQTNISGTRQLDTGNYGSFNLDIDADELASRNTTQKSTSAKKGPFGFMSSLFRNPFAKTKPSTGEDQLDERSSLIATEAPDSWEERLRKNSRLIFPGSTDNIRWDLNQDAGCRTLELKDWHGSVSANAIANLLEPKDSLRIKIPARRSEPDVQETESVTDEAPKLDVTIKKGKNGEIDSITINQGSADLYVTVKSKQFNFNLVVKLAAGQAPEIMEMTGDVPSGHSCLSMNFTALDNAGTSLSSNLEQLLVQHKTVESLTDKDGDALATPHQGLPSSTISSDGAESQQSDITNSK